MRPLSSRLAALVLLSLLAGRTGLAAPASTPAGAPELDLAPTDRVLVLAPHPDDESLGCGGVLQRAAARGIPVEVAFLTNGDSNGWSFLAWRLHPVLEPSAARKMGEIRRQEALAAAAVLGVPAARLTFLGYPDAATLNLWTSHWGDSRPPGRGPLTRARAVPYATAFRPGAPYRGEEVLADLEALLARFHPTQVFVSHPADRHPDHEALYLFTRVALWDLAGQVDARLHPYLVHYPGWPERGYRPAAPETPPLPLAKIAGWQSWGLTPEEVATKRQALAAHRSQWRSGERHLLPFARATEITGELGEGEADGLTVRRAGERVEVALPVRGEVPRGYLYLFGYRADRPFAGMPKIALKATSRGWVALDQGKELPVRPAATVRSGKLVLAVPEALLGGPDRLLVGASFGTAGRPWRAVGLAQ